MCQFWDSSNTSNIRIYEAATAGDISTDCELSLNAGAEHCQDIDKNNQTEPLKRCTDSEEVLRQENGVSKPNFSDILSVFSEEELTSLIVKNKHGEDTLFCDTGIGIGPTVKVVELYTPKYCCKVILKKCLFAVLLPINLRLGR